MGPQADWSLVDVPAGQGPADIVPGAKLRRRAKTGHHKARWLWARKQGPLDDSRPFCSGPKSAHQRARQGP
jgi:hypothetical protein